MNELRDVEIREIASLRGIMGFQTLMRRVLLEPIERIEKDMQRYPVTQRQRDELLPYWQVLKTMQDEIKGMIDSCQEEMNKRQEENPIGHIR